MQDVLTAARALIEWGANTGSETRDECALLLARVDWDHPLGLPQPAQLPFVAGNLATACSLSGPPGSPTRTLADAVLNSADQLCWHSMYAHYESEPDIAAFRRVYGYFDLISSEGPLRCHDIYMGMSLQGPDAFYPPHVHQAVETYVTVGGTGDWKRGAEPWISALRGSFSCIQAAFVTPRKAIANPCSRSLSGQLRSAVLL
ncbi:MAG: dimethylsulfonioproprionate lyase family protein [Pseudomonadota bacterium]